MSLLLILFHLFTAPNSLTKDSTVIVKEIIIEGNARTNASIIQREMTLAVGDSVLIAELSSKMERSRNNIFNRNLFITVSVSEAQRFDNQVVVKVVVKERWFLLIVPVFYLADRNFNEWWYDRGRDLRRVTYGIQMQHINLTGNADELTVKAYGGFIPYAELAYNRPYVDKRKRMGVGGKFFYSTQRSMPFRTWNDKLDFITTEDRMRERWGGFVEYNLRNALYHAHSVSVGFNSSTVADTILALNNNYFFNDGNTQRYFSLSYSYTFDKRDNRQYALKGKVFAVQATKFGLSKQDDVNQFSITSQYFWYFPIAGKFYGDINLRGKLSLPRLQPYTTTNGLGFRNNLVRGYDLYVIDGQDYGLIKSNVKYQVLNRVFDLSRYMKIKQFNTLPIAAYLSSFADVGYVKNYYPEFSNSRLGNRSLLGYGIGLDVVTWYDTIGRFNYSFNHLGERKFFFTIVRTL